MITNPNCKINLGLHIVEKRPDGYHNIETMFYPISICDKLEINAAEKFSFSQNGIQLECTDSDNLCVKAYDIIKAQTKKGSTTMKNINAIFMSDGLKIFVVYNIKHIP